MILRGVRGFGVMYVLRTNRFLLFLSRLLFFVLVYNLERYLTSNRTSFVHPIYSVLDEEMSTVLPLLFLGFHGD